MKQISIQAGTTSLNLVPYAAGSRRNVETVAACNMIEQTVAQAFGIKTFELRAPTRRRAPVALARQVAMYLAHVTCGLTLTEVGRLFGRDRTTAAHACRLVEDRRDDPNFDKSLDCLELALRAWAQACRHSMVN